MEEEYCQLLSVSRNTYYVHKREKRPIISLLEKYFSKEDLENFLSTGRVHKYDNIDNTVMISIISFLQKLDVLYCQDGNPELFYRFIIYYIQHNYSSSDYDDSWFGMDEIEPFQEIFYEYLVESGASMKQLRHTSLFINQLSRADLLFLNMNILDGFELMFNFKHPEIDKFFFSMYTRSDLLVEMEYGLKVELREEAGLKGEIGEMMRELMERTKEMRIEKSKISPE